MRYLLAIALLAASLPAYPEAFRGQNPFSVTGNGVGQPPAHTTIELYPFNSSGNFSVPPSTVAHLTWDGASVLDPYNVSTPWDMQGTVPMVQNSPFYPGGFTNPTRQGAGPFTTSDYYVAHAAVDALDFAGDFTCHAAFNPTADGGTHALVAADDSGAGWSVASIGTASVSLLEFGNAALPTSNAPTAFGPNVVSWGRSGTTAYIKLNLATTASATHVLPSPATSTASRIGASYDGANAASGEIYDVLCAPSAWNETEVTQQQYRYFGLLSVTGAMPTMTRAGPAYLEGAAGEIYQWPPNVLRVGCQLGDTRRCGVIVETLTTGSQALQSNSMSTGSAFVFPWSGVNATVSTVAAPPGSIGSIAEITSTTFDGYALGTVDFSPGTVASGNFIVTMAKPSGTGYAGFQFYPPVAAGTCSCWRDDGGTCTATKASDADPCTIQVSDLGPTPVRIGAKASVGGGNSFAVRLNPGQVGVSTGTTRFWSANGFSGDARGLGSPVVTTTSTVTRVKDTINVANPFLGLNLSPSIAWCIGGNMAGLYAGYLSNSAVWAIGTTTANSARLMPGAATTLQYQIYDQNAATVSISTTVAHDGSPRLIYAGVQGRGTKPVVLRADGAIPAGYSVTGSGLGYLGTFRTPVDVFPVTWIGSYSVRDLRFVKGSCP